jgi:hypothetical protein
MLKINLLLISLLIFSCGKVGPGDLPLVTYNVPTAIYNKYINELNAVAGEIVSLTGKQLVKFVPNDSNPKYGDMDDALSEYNHSGEAWILIKENKSEFTDIGSTNNPMGLVFLNFSIPMTWSNYNFHQVVAHEVLHCLGYEHTFDSDYSIMNYNYVYNVNGLTALDHDRLAADYPFSLEVVTIKDLEKVAAFNERDEVEKYAYRLMDNFGLSESRAQTLSRHLISYKKLNNQRALTTSEKEVLSKEILGFGFEKGKLALEKYMQGEKESLDGLIAVAASKNETSPEHIKELFGEIFLK